MKPFAGSDKITDANSDESRARERLIMVASSRAKNAGDLLAWPFLFLFLISGKREMGSRKDDKREYR